jgi:phosphate acetyltransferase
VKARAAKGLLPILLSPLPSFETSALLSRIEPVIQGNSLKKIERSQLIFEEHVDIDLIARAVLQERPVRMNPKLFQHNLFERAKKQKQHIVLPEGEEPRTLRATAATLRRDLANITLLGNPEKIKTLAKKLRVDISKANIIDPSTSQDLEKYADHFYELRKKKGLTREQARSTLVEDVNYFGTSMVALDDADGMVSGAVHTTANTVRPALQIIKTPPELPLVSSVFFMCLPDKVLVYGDCAINSNPTSEELATIAIQAADTAAAFGVEPRVALLSYATGTSNTGPLIQKVVDATAIAKAKRPDLPIEGPLQYDAAVNPETAKTKMKTDNSPVAGKATVLIFPDLNTGNNTYKAVQQSTGAVAMGPLLQGLRKPVNDLSRGCTVEDIMTTIALTAVQAISMKKSQPEPKQSVKVAAGA